MSKFIQLHALTVYPPSNPNRDDTGKPKTAYFGNVKRLRISSQALKRSIRLSSIMQEQLIGNMGERTQRIGDTVINYLLTEKKADQKKAEEISKKVAAVFGKLDEKKKDVVHIRQLAFISPDEKQAALNIAERLFNDEKIDPKEYGILRSADGAVDIAMFGRMLADSPDKNREAAVQVSHAITTHRVEIEDDYYTASDDLKQASEDAGAGFVGDAGFGSGVYYTYVCMNTELLKNNLNNDIELAKRGAGIFTEAFATATPSGKQNSYANHTQASYIRAECGNKQPRTLSAAFLKPVKGEDLLNESILKLKETAAAMDNAYGVQYDSVVEMDVNKGISKLENIKNLVISHV